LTPLNIALEVLATIFLIFAIIYRRKLKESEKCYRNTVAPPSLPKTKTALERELYLEIRSKILLRDHFRCQECGYYKHLEVHHIVPKSKGGGDNPENLITLCTRCHGRIHGFEKHKVGKKYGKKKHGYSRHHHRNRRKKEKRYFKQHRNEFIFKETPPKNWDEMPEEEKKKRRDEMYKLWVHN
jgi:5-methylcytosine-specific restriction endonuclease McrA